MITPVIHRVWIGDLPSKEYCKIFIDSINNCFPDFEVKWWNETKSRSFMQEHFPEWEEKLWKEDINYSVVKSDIIRYCILRKFGGIYTDLDLEVKNPNELKNAIGDNSFVVCSELETDIEFAKKTASILIRDGIPEDTRRIASYFFACSPEHPIWVKIFKEMTDRFNKILKFKEDYDVIYITGPDLISTVVNKYEKEFELKVLSVKESECIKHHFYGQCTWKKDLEKNEVGWFENK